MKKWVENIIHKLENLTGLPIKHFVKFSIVGGSGIIVNMSFFNLFRFLGLKEAISSPIAIEISIITNFFLNNFWTWKDRKTTEKKEKKLRFIKYNLIAWISGSISYGIFLLLFMVAKWNPNIAQLSGIFVGMGINFIVNHKWTFKKKD